jgi:hypothetical protein
MTMFPAPASILYQISESDLEKLILKAEERGFELGQKKQIEKPLTKEGAAKYLSISEGTLDERFRTGKLPARLRHTNGGTIYFFASELEEFIKQPKRK